MFTKRVITFFQIKLKLTVIKRKQTVSDNIKKKRQENERKLLPNVFKIKGRSSLS